MNRSASNGMATTHDAWISLYPIIDAVEQSTNPSRLAFSLWWLGTMELLVELGAIVIYIEMQGCNVIEPGRKGETMYMLPWEGSSEGLAVARFFRLWLKATALCATTQAACDWLRKRMGTSETKIPTDWFWLATSLECCPVILKTPWSTTEQYQTTQLKRD